MWCVYILYSPGGEKSYVGYSNDVERRLFEHNVSESRGFTLRYRPWQLIYKEGFERKEAARAREKFLKTDRGREFVKEIVQQFKSQMPYPPVTAKD